jgi:hypothetical protein
MLQRSVRKLRQRRNDRHVLLRAGKDLRREPFEAATAAFAKSWRRE